MTLAGRLLVAAGVVILVVEWLQPKDNTDPPDGRSGMALYTDALTGCQYLGTGWGGLTPRLYSDGVQVCVEVEHD